MRQTKRKGRAPGGDRRRGERASGRFLFTPMPISTPNTQGHRCVVTVESYAMRLDLLTTASRFSHEPKPPTRTENPTQYTI